MKRFLSAFLAFVLLIAPAVSQTLTPQVGGSIGYGFDGGLGTAANPSPATVFIPPALGFDTTSYPITPTVNDRPGMAVASGNAGITPQAMFDAASPARATPGITYFVGAPGSSPTPSDSNNCTTSITKCATWAHAIVLANASGQTSALILVDGNAEYVRALGPSGTVPTIDIAIVATGGRATTGTFDNFGAFTTDATFTNCQSLTLANVDRLVNRLVKSPYRAAGAFTNVDFTFYADPATLNAATLTTDGWTQSGGVVYVRRLDGAVPTPTNTRLYRAAVSLFKFSSGTSAVNVYLEGIDAEGGDTVGTFNYTLTAQSALKRIFVANSVTAKYAGGVVNVSGKGFAIDSMKGLAYLFASEGSANATDGINFHDTQLSGLFWLTVNCSGTDNGRGTAQSNNGLTGHDITIGIDLGGYFPNNRGGSVRFVNSAKLLVAATYSSDLGDIAQGGTTTPTAFETDNTAIMWCDRCKPDMPAATKSYLAGTGTAIHLRNPHPTLGTSNGGGGTVDTY